MRAFITALFALTSLAALGVAQAEEPAADAAITRACGISFTGEALDSNRYNRLAAGTLQVAAWYDGRAGKPTLAIQVAAPNGQKGFIRIGAGFPGGGIEDFGRGIETRQYRIGQCKLTGLFEVQGVVPNGVIDGIAFGIHARYADNTFRMLRSVGKPNTRSDFVAAWPAGMDTNLFIQRTPQVPDNIARSQAWAALFGAQLLLNGKHEVDVK